jgi:Domain of unknown function (DUF4349)
MTVNEILGELRTGRPRASDALRLQVLSLAAEPAPRARTLRERIGFGPRLALVVPAAASLAVAAAVVIGISRSGTPSGGLAVTAPATVARSAGQVDAKSSAAADAADAGTATRQAAPGPVAGRAQRYSATLSLQVDDTSALSDATQQALTIARALGGHVVSVHYVTGDDGAASMRLSVPTAAAGDAVTRLSGLGTILAQDVQIDDLQESLDVTDQRIERVRAQIAALTAAIAHTDGEAARARLVERRSQAQAELRQLRATRAATGAEARNATIQLDLRTAPGNSVAAPGSRLDRGFDKALAVLAWEAIAVLALAVVAAPLALVGAAVWATRRTRRRREEERLLATS